MKHLLLSSVALVELTAGALAADLGLFGKDDENEFFVITGGLNFKFNTF